MKITEKQLRETIKKTIKETFLDQYDPQTIQLFKDDFRAVHGALGNLSEKLNHNMSTEQDHRNIKGRVQDLLIRFNDIMTAAGITKFHA